MKIRNSYSESDDQFISTFFFEEHEEQNWVQNALANVLETDLKASIVENNSFLGSDEFRLSYQVKDEEVLVLSDYHFPVVISTQSKEQLDEILDALIRRYKKNVGRFPPENLIEEPARKTNYDDYEN